jgi:hypothetical protein
MTLSDGEKLIILLLAELNDEKKSQRELDPDFLKSAILDGQEWAIRWNYPGIPFASDPTNDPSELEDVLDILEMWDVIERTFERLSEERIAEIGIDILKADKSFPGFDGNHNAKHWVIADYLINKLDRFERFKGRYLGGAVQPLSGYERMLEVYRDTRSHLDNGVMTVDQIKAFMLARNPSPHDTGEV